MQRGSIKVRADLLDDPKVYFVCRAAGVDRDGVVGKLIRLWVYACRVSPGNQPGVVPRVDLSWVDQYVGHVGFADALRSVGWLEEKDGGIFFPELTRRPAPSRRMPPPGPDEVPVPVELDTATFRTAWGEWMAYRRSTKYPLTWVSVQKQLHFLGQFGPADATRVIEQSIRNGWRGLFRLGKEDTRGGNVSSRVATPGGKYAGVERVFPAEALENPAGTVRDAQTPAPEPDTPGAAGGPPDGGPW